MEHVEKLLSKIDGKKLLGKGLKYGLDFILTGGIGTLSDITIESVLAAHWSMLPRN